MSITREPMEKSPVEQSQTGPMRDSDWFLANFDRLVREYHGEWLAIAGHEVIAHHCSAAALRKQLDALGVRRVFVGLAHPDAFAPYK